MKSTLNYSQRSIIISVVALTIVTMSVLSWIETSQQSYTKDKNWWAVSFVDPLPSQASVQFMIENFSDEEKFTYEITSGDRVISGNDLDIKNGAAHIVAAPDDVSSSVMITVENSGQIKTLYK